MTEMETIEDFRRELARLKAESRAREPTRVGTIDVDGAAVDFSFGSTLVQCKTVAEQIYQMTCGTGRTAFDGTCGSLRTPDGDGPVVVVTHCPLLYRLPRGARWAGELIVPDVPKCKRGILLLGDCGRVQIRLDVSESLLIQFAWVDGRTGPQLWIGK